MRSIDRLLRPKAARSASRTVVCAVISSTSSTQVQLSKSMCGLCQAAHGRGLLNPQPSPSPDRSLACPHCALIQGPAARAALLPPGLAEMAQAAAFPHLKAATIHRLAELWAAKSPQRSELQDSESHVGLGVRSFLDEAERVLAGCRRGAAPLDPQSPAMALSATDAVLGRHSRVLSRAAAASISSRASSA